MLSFSVDCISHGVAYCFDCQTYYFPERSNEIINSSIDCSKCGAVLCVASKMLSDRSEQKFIIEQCIREISQLKEQIKEQNTIILDVKSKYSSILKDNVYLEKLSLTTLNAVDTLRSFQVEREKRKLQLKNKTQERGEQHTEEQKEQPKEKEENDETNNFCVIEN